ncbi:MAG: protein kinase [Gemmataceae bacterium]
MTAPNHPTPDILAAFVHGRLSDEDITTVEQHLTACSACRQAVEQVPPDSFLQQVRDAAPAPRGGTVVADASPSLAVALDELPPELADHDRYQVVRKLKEGGMGAVYLAKHRLMNRSAVLKLIRPRYLARDDIRQRFEREVNAVSQLSHANIVQAYDAFHAGDSMVLAMEYVDGIDLAAFVEAKGPMEVPLACRCLVQAALGLQYAHEQGLVHRDIKPHNLMITRKGQVKVLDFGLALLTQVDGTGSGGLTQEGMLMGTPEYLAPEQWGLTARRSTSAPTCSAGLYPVLPAHRPSAVLRPRHARSSCGSTPTSRRRRCGARPEVPEGLEAVYQKLMAKQAGGSVRHPERTGTGRRSPREYGGGSAAAAATPSLEAARRSPASARRSRRSRWSRRQCRRPRPFRRSDNPGRRSGRSRSAWSACYWRYAASSS